MKTKTKNIAAGKAKKRLNLASSKKVAVVHAKHPVLRHFRLIEHKYTGKLIHFRHTSHVVLVLILVVAGFFLYTSGEFTSAQTISRSILVGAIVPGPPPSTGAVITSPSDGSKLIGDPVSEIKGTCQGNSFVVVRDNGLTIGSINCTSGGIFNLQVQLQLGKNILSAQNYDNINQPGPETPNVTVYLSKTDGVTTATDTTEVIPLAVLEVIPDNPSIITGVSKLTDCNDYNPGSLPIGGELHVSIVCVPRLFIPGTFHQLGLIVWGGQPPYALSINWGKELSSGSIDQTASKTEDVLLSIDSPGYKLVKFNYVIPDTYRIKIIATDKSGKDAVIQTAIQVNGESKATTTNIANDLVGSSWVKSPVPFYLLAVAITLGFWGGDIFDRKWGSGKFGPKKRRRAA